MKFFFQWKNFKKIFNRKYLHQAEKGKKIGFHLIEQIGHFLVCQIKEHHFQIPASENKRRKIYVKR